MVRAPNLDFALSGADWLRTAGLRLLPRGFAGLWVGRERRAAAFGVALLALALGLSVTFPLALVALGPLVYGVPHILSDVRYLVFRPGLTKRPLFLGALAIGIGLGGFGFGVRGALVGALLSVLASRGSLQNKVIGSIVCGALLALSWRSPFYADLAFVHLHNFVGVAIWLVWRKRVSRQHWLFVGMFVAASLSITLGWASPLIAITGGFEADWTDLSFREMAWSVSGQVRGVWPERLLVLFAFAQAAHYVVWLRLIPEDDRKSAAPRSYKQTYRALVKDLGAGPVWLAFIAALVLLVWAAASIGAARNGYLEVAFFHAHLELIAIALLTVERRLPIFGGVSNAALSLDAEAT